MTKFFNKGNKKYSILKEYSSAEKAQTTRQKLLRRQITKDKKYEVATKKVKGKYLLGSYYGRVR